MRSRLAAFARIFPLALAFMVLAVCFGAAAPAGADTPGAARALRALLVAQQAQLTAADGAASDRFGHAVAISGDTVVVGAPYDDIATSVNQGSAYVFVRSGGSWSLQAKLTAADGAASDGFGHAVAISGDTIVVGADGDNAATVDQGSAYVFVRSASTWSQQAQLTAADGAASDYFGSSVAVSGDTVVVGAWGDDVGANAGQGSAYVFVRSGTSWSAQQKLTAADGAASDYFGSSVAISGGTAVVGAPNDDVGAREDQGSAYVFVRSGTTWSEQQKLTADDGVAGDYFGLSVAVSGNTVVVGAPWKIVGVKADQGAAYVFTRSGATWSQQAQLIGANGAAGDDFGYSVAISGAAVLVGAYGADVNPNADQGSAYLFVRSGATWSQQAQLTAADGATDDYFGFSVAISRATMVVGARMDHVGVTSDQGSASVFRIARPARPAARSPKGRIISRRPVFRWRAAAGAATYEVRIYKGSRLLKRQTGIVKTSWKCTRRLPRQAWLTWKVRARNVAGYGAWSGKLRFKVR